MPTNRKYTKTFHPQPIETSLFQEPAPPGSEFAVIITHMSGPGTLFPAEEEAARNLVRLAYEVAGIGELQDPGFFTRYAVLKRKPGEDGLATLFATCCSILRMPDEPLPTELTFPEFTRSILDNRSPTIEVGRITSRYQDPNITSLQNAEIQHLGFAALLRAAARDSNPLMGFPDTQVIGQVERFLVDILRDTLMLPIEIGASRAHQEEREAPTILIPVRSTLAAIRALEKPTKSFFAQPGEGYFSGNLTDYLGPVPQPEFYSQGLQKIMEAVFAEDSAQTEAS